MNDSEKNVESTVGEKQGHRKKARQPLYLEVLDGLDARRERSFLAMLLFSITTVVLAVSLWMVATAPKPVIVVPGATREGMFRPGEIPASALRDFARAYALDLAHFTPAVVKDHLDRARRRAAPKLQSIIEAQQDEVVAHVQAHAISQNFTPSRVEVTKEGEGRWKATVVGLLVQYVGSSEMKRGPYRVELDMSRTEPTEENPWGVWITSVKQGFEKKE